MSSPYPKRMFRWTLSETMDRHGITRYALTKATELSPNTVDAMYKGRPTRIDFPVIDRVIRELRNLRPGVEFGADDVFVWAAE